MKVIIAGSRTIVPSSSLISKAIKDSGFNVTEIVSGGAEGVDLSAQMYCMDRGIRTSGDNFYVPSWVWDVLGKKAGPLRNQAMAKYADAAIVIWTGQSPGSRNMINQMKQLGKPVFEVIVAKTGQPRVTYEEETGECS